MKLSLSKKNLCDLLLVSFLILAILLVYISTATDKISRWHLYNADALYIPSLFQDLFSSVSVVGWCLQPAPSFFPDMLLYGPIKGLLGNLHLAIIGYGILQCFLFIGSWLYLDRSVFRARYQVRSLIFLAEIMFFLVLSTGEVSAFVGILQSGHHFGAMLMLVISLAFVARIVGHEKTEEHTLVRYYLLLGVGATGTLLSDAIYLVQFIIPAMLSIGVLFFCSLLSKRKTVLLFISLLAPCLSSFALDEWFLRYWKPQFTLFQPSFRETLLTFSESLTKLVQWPESYWWSQQYHLFFLGIWVVFVLTTLWRVILAIRKTRQAKEQNAAYVLVIMFFLLCLLTTISAALITENVHSRYVLPALLIPLFFGWPFLLGEHPKVVLMCHANTYVLIALIMIPCGLFLAMDGFSGIKNFSALADLSDYYPDFVRCLDEQTRERGLRYGLAQYWRARPITLLSKNNLHVAQVQRSGDQLFIDHWINNINWYDYDFEFIVTDRKTGTVRTINANRMIQRFGTPADRFSCDHELILVYNRPTDTEFQTQFRHQSFDFAFTAAQLPSETGRIVGESRIAEETSDETGCLTYGPYLSLFLGDYSFEIYYTAKQSNEKHVGKWDVIIHTGENVATESVKKGDFEAGEGVIAGKFAVRKTGITEIRSYYKGRGMLRIDKILVKRMR